MKKIFLLGAVCAALIACKDKNADKQTAEAQMVDTHTAENSLDWTGTYKGTLPCASCPGIETTLELSENNTYKKTQIYLDEKDGTFNEDGSFTWSQDGGSITLKSKDGQTEQYQVREGCIVFLDSEGKEITGDLAEHYVLKKAE